MVSHSAQTVTDGALSLISARPEPGYRIEAAELFAALPPDDIDAAIGSAAAVCNQGPTTGQPAVTLAREPSLSVRQTWELSFIVRNLKAAGTPLDGAAVAHVGGRNEAGPLLAGFGANVEMIAVAPFDGEGIAETGGLARSANWRFGSVHNLPAESDAYAVVTSTGAMNGIAGRAYALRELLRIVRPGGLLCLTFSISSRGPEGIAPTTAGDLDGASLKAILQDAGLPDRPFGEDEVRASVQAMSRATNDARRDTTIAGLLIRRTK
jgi:SAM-dependent methyltransferase